MSDQAATRPRLAFNTHLHVPPNFSAFTTVEDAVETSAREGVKVIGTSNFHDFGVYDRFEAAARQHGLAPLFGLEFISLLEDEQRNGVKINDPGNPGRAYICGKGIPAPADLSAASKAFMATAKASNESRTSEMVELIGGLFAAAGLPLDVTYQSIVDVIAERAQVPAEWVVLQERHVALGFQVALFEALPPDGRAVILAKVYSTAPKADQDDAVATQGELRSRLMKAGCAGFVEETPVPFTDALAFIRGLGAITVYPTLADGVIPMCGYEDPVEDLIERMGGHDIYGAELIPVRNTPQMVEKIRQDLARRRHLRHGRHRAQHPGAHPGRADLPAWRAAQRRGRGHHLGRHLHRGRPPAPEATGSGRLRRCDRGAQPNLPRCRDPHPLFRRDGRGTPLRSHRDDPMTDLRQLRLLAIDDPLIRDAIEMSHRFGRDPEYTRGGGGNSSIKEGGIVYYQAQWRVAGGIEAGDLVPLATGPLLDLLLNGGAEADEARIPGAPDPVMRAAAKVRMAEAKGRRPSVELMFHSLLPERYVLHTHAIVPNAVTCNQDGEAIMRDLFGDDALWVPYTDPGLPLARKIHELRRGAPGTHGQDAPGSPSWATTASSSRPIRPARSPRSTNTSWAPSAPPSRRAASAWAVRAVRPRASPPMRPMPTPWSRSSAPRCARCCRRRVAP